VRRRTVSIVTGANVTILCPGLPDTFTTLLMVTGIPSTVGGTRPRAAGLIATVIRPDGPVVGAPTGRTLLAWSAVEGLRLIGSAAADEGRR